MLKRIGSVLLAVAMLLPVGVFAAAPPPAPDALQAAYDNGLLVGDQQAYPPTASITRAQAATALSRMLRLTAISRAQTFSDLLPDTGYSAVAAQTAHAGLLQGTGSGRFSGDKPMTGAALAVALQRLLHLPEAAAPLAPDTPPWAASALRALYGKQILNTNFLNSCNAGVTRQEFAEILQAVAASYVQNDGAQLVKQEFDSLVVRADNVSLKDCIIQGDLLLADGAGSQGMTLSNVKVAGRVIIRSGGSNSMSATNCQFEGGIILDNPNTKSVVTVRNCTGSVVDQYRGEAALHGSFDRVNRHGPEAVTETPLSGDGAAVVAAPVANDIAHIFPYSDGAKNNWEDFIGVTHINPQYGFDGKDCVIEGAERLQELGTKSIKFYLSPNYRTYYAHNMDWDDYHSPLELAKSPSFTALMDMDFNTFFIGTYVFSEQQYATYWKDGFTAAQKQAEYDALYDLTYALCRRYANTDKTFILQNWEGDWSTMDVPSPATDPEDAVLARMIEWTNIRQDAVNNARRDANQPGVRVYHALEVNLVGKALAGGKTVTNNVIPYTYCDYYSYSAYDAELDADLFSRSLDYLKQKASENLIPGRSRVFVGEFGLPENEFGAKKVQAVIQDVTEISREKEIDYVLFWQLYDNEVYDPAIPAAAQTNENCRGYWMVKPSGEKTIAWNYFYKLLHGVDDPDYVPDVPQDFAAVEITLGAMNQNVGLTQPNATDGMSLAMERDGKTCHKSPGENPNLYMYFKADDDFITPTDSHLQLEFTYFDAGTSPLLLEYFNRKNQLSNKTISRTDTNTWLTATIRLSDAKFDNLFHSGFADFRFNDYGDSLYLHHLKITKFLPGGTSGSFVASVGSDVEDGLAIQVLGDISDGAYIHGTQSETDYIQALPGQHLRFDVSPEVCTPEDHTVTVEVEYFDGYADGGFVLYYTDSSPQIVRETPAVMFTGSDTWKTHSFTLTDAVLDNLWYDLADFSFFSNAHPVLVHRVTVSTPVRERDAISIVLSANPIEDGIAMKAFAFDGAVVAAVKADKPCIATNPSANTSGDAANNYIYFDADDVFIPSTQADVWITLTYFDAGEGDFELQYNSTLSDEPPDYLGLITPYHLKRTGTNTWITTTIHLDNAEFDNKLQNGFADFRLNDQGDALYVSKIAIRKTAPS